MKIKCPACSKVLTIPESAAGKIVKCPCGKQLRAPGTAAPQSPSSAATSGASPGAANRQAGQPASGRAAAGTGDFDPAMFDELTDQDLKPVKGVANPYRPAATATGGGSKLLNQYAPRGGVGGQSKREIASVGSRILGALIDGLFFNLLTGIGIGIAIGIISAAGEQLSQLQFATAFAVVGVLALIPAIVNVVLISKSGQSLGKKLAGTRMVDQQTGMQVGFVQGYLLRTIVFGFLIGIPMIGVFVAIADIIYLFIENHQTLHDKLAKTLVVKA